jgi:hypothetical protein
MTSHWQQTASEMFEICYKLRNNFPVPSSCKDEQLYEFWYEMNYKWVVNDEIISSGRSVTCDDGLSYFMYRGAKTWEQHLIDQCCYYEDMMEAIEHEIWRRPWLKNKPFLEYVGGKRCNK